MSERIIGTMRPARRHAQRVAQQIALTTHPDTRLTLETAWEVFLAQFNSDTVSRAYIRDAFVTATTYAQD